MSSEGKSQQNTSDDYERKVQSYRQLIERSTDKKEQAALSLELAWVFYDGRQFEQSINSINTALWLNPEFEQKAEVFRIKAFSYIALNELELAEKFLNKSLELNRLSEEQQVTIFELGKVFFKRQQYDKALKQFIEVDVFFFQNDQEYWKALMFFKGFCLYYLKELQQSEAVFEELLENTEDKKKQAGALYGLAYLAFDRKDYLKTINLCETVMTQDPEFFDLETVGFLVATSFHYLGRDDVFKEYAQKMINQYPDGRYTGEIHKLLSLQNNASKN